MHNMLSVALSHKNGLCNRHQLNRTKLKRLTESLWKLNRKHSLSESAKTKTASLTQTFTCISVKRFLWNLVTTKSWTLLRANLPDTHTPGLETYFSLAWAGKPWARQQWRQVCSSQVQTGTGKDLRGANVAGCAVQMSLKGLIRKV